MKIVKEIHEKVLGHKGIECTMKELTKTHYWPYAKDTITEIVKACERCEKNCQKTEGGEKFIISHYPEEIAATDIFFLTQQEAIITYIDYFTRHEKLKESEIKVEKKL